MSSATIAMLAGHGGLATLYAAMLAPAPEAAAAVDVDRVEAGARAAGVAEGEARATAALLPLRTALCTATEALAAAATIEPARLRDVFARLVTALAEAVVGAELTQNPAVVARLVDTALAEVATVGAIVRVHPDDAVLFAGDLEVTPDPTLARGSVVVDGPDFVVRDGLAERLVAVLGDLA